MLAYLFWHAASNASTAEEYERKILHFGRALALVLGMVAARLQPRRGWFSRPTVGPWGNLSDARDLLAMPG